MRVQIRLSTGNLPDVRFYLRGPGPFLLGSDPECAIPIQARGISRKHLELYFDESQKLCFRDLGSRNGTLLNSHRCDGAALQEGHLLQVGHATVHIEGTATEFLGYQPDLEKLQIESLIEVRGTAEYGGQDPSDPTIPWLDIGAMVKDLTPPFQRNQLWEHACRWFVRITGSVAAKCCSIRQDVVTVNSLIGEFPEDLLSASVVKACMQIPYAATFRTQENAGSSSLFSLPVGFDQQRAVFIGRLPAGKDPISQEPSRLLTFPAILRFIFSWAEALEEQKAHSELLRHELQALKSDVVMRNRTNDPILGESKALLQLLEVTAVAAPTDMTVMLLGETGVGKELLSRRIHDLSLRAGGPFLPVNCAAIPANLLESELFGAEKGAYTGLDRPRIGRIEAAQGGTLFLDEVADLPREVQAVLLRFLEDKKISPLGSNQERKIDVRLIAATNRPPRELRDPKVMRPDLYFRLTQVILEIPPLRDRGNDIFLLAMAFLSSANREFGRSAAGFTEEAIETMKRYSWPGNIRELMGLVKRLVLHCRPDAVFSAQEVTQALCNPSVDQDKPDRNLWNLPIKKARRAFEKEYLTRRLSQPVDSFTALADSVGIARTNLYNKLHNLGLNPDDSKSHGNKSG